MKKGGPPGPPFFVCRIFDCRLFAGRAGQPVASTPTQSEMVCQKKKATARTMMAMSMGTAPVDCGGWACRRILYDSSRRGCSASVRLRQFFTPRTAAKTAACKKMQGKFSDPATTCDAVGSVRPVRLSTERRHPRHRIRRRRLRQSIVFKWFSWARPLPERSAGCPAGGEKRL